MHKRETQVIGIVHWRREDLKRSVIELRVGDGNQRLMPRAVVPAKPFGNKRLLADMQQAFHIGDACGTFLLLIVFCAANLVEERGRRKLTGISHND